MSWSANNCTVNFDAGANGSIDGSITETVAYGGSPTSVPTVTAYTGYIFIGWKSSETKGIYDETAVTKYTVTDDVTFTAQYTDSANATVIFDYNGGVLDGATSSYVSGKPNEGYNVPTPEKVGYQLNGWESAKPDGIFW